MFLKYEHVNVLVDILEGKKKAANEERAVKAAAQAIIDVRCSIIDRDFLSRMISDRTMLQL
jgi:hypothetical protein